MPMKVLFVVQGEVRGHLTQAIAMEDLLRRNGHEVVEVLVGKATHAVCLVSLIGISKHR